jgi:hypothetical protein
VIRYLLMLSDGRRGIHCGRVFQASGSTRAAGASEYLRLVGAPLRDRDVGGNPSTE